MSDSGSRSHAYTQGKNSLSLSHTIHKNSRWTVDLHMKGKTIKFLKDNREAYIVVGKDFLIEYMKSSIHKGKKDKLNFSRI